MSTHARGDVRGAGALRPPARAGGRPGGPGLLARHQGPLFVTPALLAMAALILYPLLAGDGKALFGTVHARHKLELRKAEALSDGRVSLVYGVVN